jgi:hypothetical protein
MGDSVVAKSLFHKEPFRPVQLRNEDSGMPKAMLRALQIPFVSEFVLVVAALGAVYAFAFVFLDFRVSKYLNLLGL